MSFTPGKALQCFLLVCLLCAMISCAGQSVYHDAGETTQMGADFSDTDHRMMATYMYSSLQSRLSKIMSPDAPTPVVALLRVDNRTSEHIDTDVIIDKLQINMIKAGTLRFVDRSRIQAHAQEWDWGSGGMISSESVKQAGNVLGADYLIAGDLTSIKKYEGRTQLSYYRVSLRMLDVETTEVVWADEYEIKKKAKKGLLNW